jgi:hypothetical protein
MLVTPTTGELGKMKNRNLKKKKKRCFYFSKSCSSSPIDAATVHSTFKKRSQESQDIGQNQCTGEIVMDQALTSSFSRLCLTQLVYSPLCRKAPNFHLQTCTKGKSRRPTHSGIFYNGNTASTARFNL